MFKIFSRKEKREEQKKNAQARKMLKVQKFLEKTALKGMGEVENEVKKVRTEYEALLKETAEILPLMDQEISERKDQGEDTSQMELQRQGLAQNIQAVKTALDEMPASPFTTPGAAC